MFRDPEVRKGLRYDVIDDTLPRVFSKRWDLMYVQEAQLEKNKKLEKKSIAEIARAMEKDVFDTFLDLALEEDLKTSFITPLINGEEDAVRTIIQHPASLVSLSDGGAHVQYICDTGYPSHMLGYWVRDKQALTMEKAIQVLAATPARVLGLTDRGQIAPGKVADLVVFDPARIRALEPVTVRDLPGGNPRLFQGAEGIHHTIVNGTSLTKDGKHLGSYPGQVLRGAGPTI